MKLLAKIILPFSWRCIPSLHKCVLFIASLLINIKLFVKFFCPSISIIRLTCLICSHSTLLQKVKPEIKIFNADQCSVFGFSSDSVGI